MFSDEGFGWLSLPKRRECFTFVLKEVEEYLTAMTTANPLMDQ